MAKQQLRGKWGTAILVTAITMFISLLFELPALIQNVMDGFNSIFHTGTTAFSFYFNTDSSTSRFSILSFFAACILETAQMYMYLRMASGKEQITFNTFLDGLTYWLRALLSTVWMYLWIILWSCLFIIPGIVKAFAYSQIFFLITEYPHMKIRKALQISKLITRGHKGDLFVMFLSFIGWSILCLITCGIGFLWLIPYQTQSFANAYLGIKQDALNRGIITLQDLA